MREAFPKHVKKALLNRNDHIMVNAGRSMQEYAGKIDDVYIAFYSEFDGFSDGSIDSNSTLYILPFSGISKYNGQYIFADFLMGSDQYMCDLNDHKKPIISVEKQDIIASSYLDFWQKLIDGHYDFL